MTQAGPGLQGRSPAIGPTAPAVRWSLPGSYDQPAIAADGTLYVHHFDTASIDALLPDGGLGWSFSLDGGGDFVGTPALRADGTLVIGSYVPLNTNGASQSLFALTAAGAVAWELPLGADVQSAPTLGPDGTIYVVTDAWDPVPPVGDYNFQLVAVHPDGTLAWSSASWTTGSDVAFTSMPAVGTDGTIYLGGACGLNAFAPDGGALWSYDDPAGRCVQAQSVGDDGTVYALFWEELAALDLNLDAFSPGGSLAWSLDLGDNLAAGPAIAGNGTLVVNGWDNVVAVSPGGSEEWVWDAGIGNEGPSPVVDAAGIFYVAQPVLYGGPVGQPPKPDGQFGLVAILPDGGVAWSFEPTLSFNAPAIGADGTLYTTGAGESTSALYAIGEADAGS